MIKLTTKRTSHQSANLIMHVEAFLFFSPTYYNIPEEVGQVDLLAVRSLIKYQILISVLVKVFSLLGEP